MMSLGVLLEMLFICMLQVIWQCLLQKYRKDKNKIYWREENINFC